MSVLAGLPRNTWWAFASGAGGLIIIGLTPGRPPLWLLGGLLLLVAVQFRPDFGLYAIPFAVAFGSLVAVTVHGIHVGITDILVVGLVGTAIRDHGRDLVSQTIVHRVRDFPRFAGLLWRAQRLRVLVYGSLVCYLAAVSLSIFMAESRTATLKEIAKWTEVLALVAITDLLVSDFRRLRILVWGIIGAGLLQAFMGFTQWVISSGDLGPGSTSIRVFGTFDQPNPYAAFLNFGLALAFALALFADDARERWVAGASGLLLLSASYLANSRGALLAVVAAATVMVVVGLRREILALKIAAVSIPLIAAAWFTHIVPASLETKILRQFRVNSLSLTSQVDRRNYSTIERVAHWAAGMRMFEAHPILGVGAGNYPVAYAQFGSATWPNSLGQAHNYYINSAAETGIVGLLAFVSILVAALCAGWLAAHHGDLTTLSSARWPLGTRRALAIGCLGIVITVSIHSLVDDLFVHAMELVFALCIGCLLALQRNREHGA